MKIKRVIIYACIGILCIIINYIYAQFSHGVSSAYMTYMFIIPILGGIISLLLGNNDFNKLKQKIYACGIATLTIGAFINGVFEIAGTSSNYQLVYYICGLILIIIAFIKNWK